MQRNMKKIMAGALSVCLFATNTPGVIELGGATHLCEVVQAATGKTYSGTCGENAKWKYNTSTKTLSISGTGKMEDYTDPEDEEAGENNPPTKWRPWEKYTKTKIEKVVIGDGITRIGDYAFVYTDKLKEVKIGKSVEAIGAYAFDSCIGLKTITLGDKVEKIEIGAFYNCTALKEVNLGKAIKEVGTAAFLSCSSLKKIDLKEGVQRIGDSAFDKCKALEQVTLGDDLQEIGKKAFYKCEKLESIYLGKSLKNIGKEAFFKCWGMKDIKLYAENEYFALDENVLMNKEKTELYFGAFVENTTCNVNANVENIDRTIINHTKLESFEVSSENQKYYSEDGLLYRKDENRLIVCPKGKKGTAVISDKAVSIDAEYGDDTEYEHEYYDDWYYNVEPFSNCAKLEKIIIGKNVKYLDGELSGCSSLKEVEIDEENDYYAMENGLILNKDKNKVIQYIMADKNGTSTMPSSVTDVEYNAYSGGLDTPKHIVLSNKLSYFVKLPYGVEKITLGDRYYNDGDLSWIEDAKGIKKINVSKNNSHYSSVDGVLYTKDKKNLIRCPQGRTGKITVSNKTTTIRKNAFRYAKVNKIVIPKTVKKIGNQAFFYINAKATFYVPKGKKKFYKKLLTKATGFRSTMTIKEK